MKKQQIPLECEQSKGFPTFSSDENLENFAEKTFEDFLENSLKNSENRLKSLEEAEKEILFSENSKNLPVCPDAECWKNPYKSSEGRIFTRFELSADGVKVTTPDVDDGSKYHGLGGLGGSGNPKNPNDGETQNDEEISENSRHPQTIRKYVQTLLTFFSNLRTEYTDQSGKIFTRKLPVFYATREKLISIDEHEFTELFNGNTNYLPRASLSIDGLSYNANRQSNKNTTKQVQSMAMLAQGKVEEFSAPTPYDITVRLNIMTRGMLDAMMLVEQVCAFFNPYYTFTLLDTSGSEQQVRLNLDSVSFEPPEVSEFSANEVMVEFGFTLFGYMFKPATTSNVIDTVTANFGLT